MSKDSVFARRALEKLRGDGKSGVRRSTSNPPVIENHLKTMDHRPKQLEDYPIEEGQEHGDKNLQDYLDE